MKLTNAQKRDLRERARRAAQECRGEPAEVLRALCAGLHGPARKEARRAFWKEWK